MYGVGQFPGPLDDNLALYDEQTLADNTASTTIDLGSGFAPHPPLPVQVVTQATAVKTTVGDEAYTFKIQERAASTDDWADTGVTITLTATGTHVWTFGASKRYVRLLPVISGTSPSITLSAHLIAA